jgi:hypothetical protein
LRRCRPTDQGSSVAEAIRIVDPPGCDDTDRSSSFHLQRGLGKRTKGPIVNEFEEGHCTDRRRGVLDGGDGAIDNEEDRAHSDRSNRPEQLETCDAGSGRRSQDGTTSPSLPSVVGLRKASPSALTGPERVSRVKGSKSMIFERSARAPQPEGPERCADTRSAPS